MRKSLVGIVGLLGFLGILGMSCGNPTAEEMASLAAKEAISSAVGFPQDIPNIPKKTNIPTIPTRLFLISAG